MSVRNLANPYRESVYNNALQFSNTITMNYGDDLQGQASTSQANDKVADTKFDKPLNPVLVDDSQNVVPSPTEVTYVSYVTSKAQQFGYRLDFESNKSSFQNFPNYTVNILNSTTVERNTYEVRAYTSLNASNPWHLFNPLDSNDKTSLSDLLLSFWNESPEGTQIHCDFILNRSMVDIYQIAFFKDTTSPEYVLGLNLDTNNAIIPYNGSLRYYKQAPIIQLDISDNVPAEISIFFTVNNHLYTSNTTPNCTSTETTSNNNSTTLSYCNSISILLPEWEKLPQGKNDIIIYLNDSADNPTKTSIISFIKDTLAPVLDSGITAKPWFLVANYSLSEIENPIYQTLEIEECPHFHFQFQDDDIDSVKMYLNISDLDWAEINKRENTTGTEDPMHPIFNLNLYQYIANSSVEPLQNPPTPSTSEYGDSYLNASHINETYWEIQFPDSLWSAFTPGESVEINLVIVDVAGNEAIFDFLLVRNEGDNIIEQIDNILLFFILTMGLLIFVSIAIPITYISEKRSKANPLEQDLEEMDGELLDVILQPLDPVKRKKLQVYLQKLGKNIDLTRVTPPDLMDFLKEKIQIVNLKELQFLISTFKMDPQAQEEFLHEMLALGTEDRHDFIRNYMINQIESEEEVDLAKDDDYFDDDIEDNFDDDTDLTMDDETAMDTDSAADDE
jgi:hypothetical protein